MAIENVLNPNCVPHVWMAGVQFAAVSEQQCIEHILDALDAGRGGWVVTPNLDILRRIVNDVLFAELVSKSTLLLADGMPLVWVSRLQGTPLPQRVAGSDLISSLSAAASHAGRSVFLVGGDLGTAEQAAAVLRGQCPGLRIAGTYFPPPGFEHDASEWAALRAAVCSARPDIVYVALGCPKQEHLIDRLRGEFPGTWWLGVGISFSFLSGDVRRAPRWLQRIGLEWLHRLIQEPRRLARRYLIDGPPFVMRLLIGALMVRLSGTQRRT